MSFSSDTKNELCRLQNRRDCCHKAEGYGLLLFSKCFSKRGNKIKFENGNVARTTAEYAAAVCGVIPELSTKLRRGEKQAFELCLEETDSIFKTFGHREDSINLRINGDNFICEDCIAAFLRGVFIVCGAVTDPNKKYNMEFIVPYKMLSEDLLEVLRALPLGLEPSLAQRKGSYVIYIKDSSKIEDLLTFIGASGASMELMQVKMYKTAVNNINRKSNFETANVDKTLSASAKQTAAIAILTDTIGLSSLPEELMILAELRLHNPEMSLKEMSAELGISRSAVNHRIQKIIKLSEDKKERVKELIEG